MMKLLQATSLFAMIAVSQVFAADPTSATNSKARQARPNIIFILADDLGFREAGCFGQERIKTPNLDRLAADGLKLTQHYCGNAVCAPSRCVLMSGLHPGHATIRSNMADPPEGQAPIPDEDVTVGELLQQGGYVTGAFGKWGLGGPDTTGNPNKQGFDRFFGYLCQSHAHSYYPSFLRSDGGVVELDNNPAINGHANFRKGDDKTDPAAYEQFKGTDYAPDHINAEVLKFIRQHKEEPFFCYYPTVIPHVALHVPDRDLQPYLDLNWNDPPFTKQQGYGYTPHYTPRAAYAAMISRMDGYIGNVLNLLDELQLTENTIVIFSSDNGTTHLKLEVDYDFFKSVGELRGLKGSLYEGGVRVPTIVRWPGVVEAGSESNFVSGFEDWMPTLLEISGHENLIPGDCDGISLVPTLKGRDQPEREFLYREFAGYGQQQTIRVGPWKAVRQNLKAGRIQTELYNIVADVGETKDVAGQHPEILQKLEAMMAEQHIPSELFPIKAIEE